MAFSDLPIVDQYSKNSELSERALEVFLNQQSGFICRPDNPDKGCDFDVELMIDGKSAANRRFGIQVKSVETLNLLADGQTISYSFETSRLGYLLNRPVAEGLLVIYDVAGGVLYYEYVVVLYNRLMDERSSDEWLQKDSVNMHIPVINVLNEAGASAIHAHFQNHFETAAFLIASQGPRYGMAVVKSESPSQYDLKNPEQVRGLLQKHGFALLYDHDIELCFNLLRLLPLREIDSDPILLVMAAIAYGEMGRRYDAENFIRKINRRDDILPSHRQMVRFGHLKNQVILEEIDIPVFITGAKAILSEETNPRNILLLNLNIIFYELLATKFYHTLTDDMLYRIRSVFEQIPNLETDERSKQLVEANNAENLSQYILVLWGRFFNELAIQRVSGITQRSAVPALQQTPLLALEGELNVILERLYTEAQVKQDKLLQAQALLVQSRFMVAREISQYSQWPILNNLRFHNENKFNQYTKLALSGHDHFMDVGYVELAYQSLVNGIDLTLIGRKVYGYSDDIDLDFLYTVKVDLEKHGDLHGFEPSFPQLVERLKNHEKEYMSETRNLDDQQLQGMANSLGRALKLPVNCQPNLFKELWNCRLFYQRSPDHLELLQYEPHFHPNIRYRSPIRFVIRNKRTNLRSVPSSDVGGLLDSWGV